MRFGLIFLSVFVILSNTLYVFSSDLQEILKMKKIKSFSQEIETHIKEKKYDHAREKLIEGFKIDRDTFDLIVLSGKVYYLDGDIINAYNEFKRANKINPSDPYVLSWLSKINVENNKFHTEHFNFFKVPESRKWALKLPLEENFKRITEILDVSLKKRIDLYFYDNEKEFFKEYGDRHLHKKGKLLGVAQIKKNRILINSIVSEKDMLSVIMHELVHFLIHEKMKDSRLFGIEEGLANFIGGRRANYKALKRNSLLTKAIPLGDNAFNYEWKIDFESMIFYKFNDLHDWQNHTILYYELSTALIEFIHYIGGNSLLKQYINDLMRKNMDYYRFTWATLGFSTKKEFEVKFLRFIQKNMFF